MTQALRDEILKLGKPFFPMSDLDSMIRESKELDSYNITSFFVGITQTGNVIKLECSVLTPSALIDLTFGNGVLTKFQLMLKTISLVREEVSSASYYTMISGSGSAEISYRIFNKNDIQKMIRHMNQLKYRLQNY